MPDAFGKTSERLLRETREFANHYLEWHIRAFLSGEFDERFIESKLKGRLILCKF